MKILFLNPHIDSSHPTVQAFRRRGVAVFIAVDPLQAWQILKFHGRSVELAIVHREDIKGEGESGFEFLASAKEDSQQSDLPILVTSAKWGADEFTRHQSGPEGGNAYLPWPSEPEAFVNTVGAIFGTSLPEESPEFVQEVESDVPVQVTPLAVPKRFESAAPGVPNLPVIETAEAAPPVAEAPPPEPELDPTALVLEDAAALFQSPEPAEPSLAGGIKFDAPELSAEELATIALHDPKIQAANKAKEEEEKKRKEEEEQRKAIGSFVNDISAEDIIDNAANQQSGNAIDTIIASEMPYLFGSGNSEKSKVNLSLGKRPPPAAPSAPQGSVAPAQTAPEPERVDYVQPLGDAVVPGGAAHAPDLETFKKYLLLREQDVAALSQQLKQAKDQVRALDVELRKERARHINTQHELDESSKRIGDFEKEKEAALAAFKAEIEELKFQGKAKADKVKLLETQVRDAAEEMGRLKERVRIDIRKVRVREKELENRLEIMKRDSEALMGARENKIMELKRKLDLLEFNMDLLQHQHERERETNASLKEKLNRALQAVRVAGGLLDADIDAGTLGSPGTQKEAS